MQHLFFANLTKLLIRICFTSFFAMSVNVFDTKARSHCLHTWKLFLSFFAGLLLTCLDLFSSNTSTSVLKTGMFNVTIVTSCLRRRENCFMLLLTRFDVFFIVWCITQSTLLLYDPYSKAIIYSRRRRRVKTHLRCISSAFRNSWECVKSFFRSVKSRLSSSLPWVNLLSWYRLRSIQPEGLTRWPSSDKNSRKW